MNPDHSHERLEERISRTLERLSPKQRQLARFLLDNRYFVSFASAGQVASKTDSSAATVVRFAQALGYEGFSELQAAIREELPSYLTAAERIQEGLSSPALAENVAQVVFQKDVQNIQRTANALELEKLEAALDLIIQSERILVIGSGLSAAAALYMAHSLRVIGFDAQSLTDGGLFSASHLALLRPPSLLIAIDLYRYLRTTASAVTTARENGARVIAITDSLVSPLARNADHAFEVAIDGVAHSLSAAALISILNVLIAALSLRIPEQTVEALRRVDSAYRTNQLLITE